MNEYNYRAKFPVRNGEFTPEVREFVAKLRADNPGRRVCYFYNGPRRHIRGRFMNYHGNIKTYTHLNRNTYKKDATEVRVYLY